jgi:hypothetical protein
MAGKMPSYTETLILLAEKYGRSEKAIEAIISAGDQTKERGDWKRDYERLEAAIYKRFPKK